MDFDFIRSATSKELEQFKSVCNQLLSRTYIVRTLFRPGKGRVNNPDYTFLSLHYEAVQEYLRRCPRPVLWPGAVSFSPSFPPHSAFSFRQYSDSAISPA